ncbi:MAG: hypothetical protein V8S98_11030 [Lachnospiraceae bacterium]
MCHLVKNFLFSQKYFPGGCSYKISQPEQIVDIDLLSIVSKELEGEFLDQLYLSFENSFGTFEEILKKKPEFTIETSHSSCHIDLAKRIVHLNQDFKSVRLKTSTSDFHKHREDKNYYTI